MEYELVYSETGEIRPPLAGEWFRDHNGKAEEGNYD